MRTTTFARATAAVAIAALAIACGSAGLSGFGADSTNPNGSSASDAAGAGFNPTATSPGADNLTPVDNAVILVHAAKSLSYRLCFQNEGDRLPQPDSQVMPNANVVGVEVGGAVRLGPLRGKPGKVLLFDEPIIRAYYPQFGGAGRGPTCNQLLANQAIGKLAIDLGVVDVDLSQGVHLLVVRGCTGDTQVRTFSKAECGDTWTSTNGNLSVKEITLPGARRPTPGILPAQVVNLSQPLEGARGGRDVVVTFGDLVAPGAKHEAVVTDPSLFGGADPTVPAALQYAAADTAVYESLGFRVSLVAKGDGGTGGAATTVLDESLARIQSQSSPRDVPPTYYAAASNYALLLLGDPAAKLADGGPDQDDRRNLHFLAVPVIEPKDDAGTDGGSGVTTGDGGAGGAR